MKQRFLNILFWSVLAAAFIGPGTVTTAASAGAGFGYALIWALIFSTIACYVLQEASARLTVVSGNNLGEAMKQEFSSTLPGRMAIMLALFSIILGCAAYEAGNILGAVSGLILLFEIPQYLFVLGIGVLAWIILWYGTIERIALLLGVVVAIMGLCFLSTALLMDHSFTDLFRSAVIPSAPAGSELLILGLIGTTVVPYNIFLGSGMKHSQSAGEMKLSMAVAIGLGGLISVAVLLVGTSIAGSFSFVSLSEALTAQLGGWAAILFGVGLFSAGLSSSLTAALAASITARSILRSESNSGKWKRDGRWFRSVWIGVLGIGLFFGVINVQPIPVIILAQALNGLILPVIAVMLLILINHSKLIPTEYQNSLFYNFFTGVIVFITVVIGVNNVFRALSRAFELPLVDEVLILTSAAVISLLIAWPVIKKIKTVNVKV
jgi:Mn2+/Fe2+ NRAMP family transporter